MVGGELYEAQQEKGKRRKFSTDPMMKNGSDDRVCPKLQPINLTGS